MEDYDNQVRELEEKITSVSAVITDFEKKRAELQLSLTKLKMGHGKIGKPVVWYETCHRGCCIEATYKGVVVGVDDANYYIVQADGGQTNKVHKTDIQFMP